MKIIVPNFLHRIFCDAFPVFLFALFMIIVGAAMMFSGYVEVSAKIEKLESHIEYLEEYIEENHLPTPAMRNEK